MDISTTILLILVLSVASCALAQADELPSGSWARYDLLSTVERVAPPVSDVVVTVGPTETADNKTYQWWEVLGEKASGEHFAVRLLSEAIPIADDEHTPGTVKHYLLRENADQPLEYVDARTGSALLPKFDFVEGLLPQSMPGARREAVFATCGTYLGHVLSLVEEGTSREWTEWPRATLIKLNPDEIHYMHSLRKDTEGGYISHGDYTYEPLTHDELDELIDAGMNSFRVDDQYEDWVYRRPVFYYRRFSGDSRLDYPQILYRSNLRGAVAFIDEPEIHILSDKEDLAKIRRPEEGAYLIAKRLEEIWNHQTGTGRRRSLLSAQLHDRGVNLGTLTLDDDDHPIWVTMLETSFYQLQGGAAGVVHEGRYQLGDFVWQCHKFLGPGLQLSTKEMLLLNYAWLRGAARAFHKDWGMAIYGQCDPEIAPDAVTLAYDMGARYVWFWTSDHQHHLPHFMKLRLMEHLQNHKSAHPRPSLDKLLYSPRTAVVLPYGYGYYLNFHQMWESPHLHINYSNAAGVPHRDVFAAALAQGIACAKAGEDFDFVVDIGQDFEGYSRVVKVGLDGRITDSAASPPAEPLTLQLSEVRSSGFPRGSVSPENPTVHIPYKEYSKIDGDLAKWEDAEWITIDEETHFVNTSPADKRDIAWTGPEDLSAALTFAYDDRQFYVAARITDDKFSQTHRIEDSWNGDSLQVALDLWLDRSTGFRYNFAEVGLALTADGAQAFLCQNAEGSDRGPTSEGKVCIKRGKGNEMIYEVAIPWERLTALPVGLIEVGGIRFRANDGDGYGRKGWLQLADTSTGQGDYAEFVPARFGPMPSEKQAEVCAGIDDTRRLTNDRTSLDFALVSRAAAQTPADLEIVLETSGTRAAEGSLAVELPQGRQYIRAVVDAGSLCPGVYRCRAKLRAKGKLLAESSFPVYVLK